MNEHLALAVHINNLVEDLTRVMKSQEKAMLDKKRRENEDFCDLFPIVVSVVNMCPLFLLPCP